jgi:hypothetical protein
MLNESEDENSIKTKKWIEVRVKKICILVLCQVVEKKYIIMMSG